MQTCLPSEVEANIQSSGSHTSAPEATLPSPPTSPQGLGRIFSAALLKGQLEPTVVHRTQFKSRPSVISFDKGIVELTPESTPSTSAESSRNSGKVSIPRQQSTGKTSLDSKFSAKSKAASQHSSDNKKEKAATKQAAAEKGSNENALTPIAEVEALEAPVPVPVPVPSKSTSYLSCTLLISTKLLSRLNKPQLPRCSSSVTITDLLLVNYRRGLSADDNLRPHFSRTQPYCQQKSSKRSEHGSNMRPTIFERLGS